MEAIVFLVMVSVAMAVTVRAQDEFLPPEEIRILKAVAREYDLDREQTAILLAIRRFENGPAGLELGVGQDIPDHPARRFEDDPDASLRLQGQWAAGTIAKRYYGQKRDLTAFAKRYCPKNSENWEKAIRSIMRQAYRYV